MHCSGSTSRLALGTVQFGRRYGIANVRGRVDESEVRRILAYAREAGIDMLDTAVVYGDAERVLGRLGVTDFRVISKLPAVGDVEGSITEWLLGQVEQSLRRLGIGQLYGLLLHHPGDLVGPYASAIVAALAEIKTRGWAGKIGVSVYSPDQLRALIGRLPIELVQIPFSVLDRRFEASDWLIRLAGMGVEIHARSVFLQGLLLMPPTAVPSSFLRFAPLLARWHSWLNAEGIGALEGCLAHVSSYSEISRYVVGCDGLDQLREIVAAICGPIRRAPIDLASTDPSLLNPSQWSKT